jgi:TolB-like protein
MEVLNSRLFQQIGIVGFCLGLQACTTMDDGRPQITKEIKDVSYEARGEDEAPRKRLMILPFVDSKEGRTEALSQEAREAFVDELNRTKALIVVDSKDMKIDLTKAMQGGEYKFSELIKDAQNLGVSALLEAKVIDLKVKKKSDEVGVFRQLKTIFECRARIRIASARSGKELFNTVKTVTVEEKNVRVAETVDSDRFFISNPEILKNLMTETFLDFTPQIIATMDKLSWEGRVAAIQGERIFLNVGRISGLNLGDVLKVSEEGDEVYDPQTGNYIGKAPGRLKGTLEVISYFGQDGSIAVIHSGSGFRENDRIELY